MNKQVLNDSNIHDIPILFLIFNRLDTTKQVFDIIRKVSPSKLYIASDGPRETKEGEKENVENVRNYVLKSIDWNCEIKTLFRDDNLGCGRAVSNAITWFFENEEMGIILEDDCLPSMSFFPYCKKLLEKYKNNEQIYHIAGYNPLTVTKISHSYYFARIQHCWGWASWRRAWNHYNFNITDLDGFVKQKKINKIFTRSIDRKFWLHMFGKIKNHEIDTWDYQWTYSILNNNGICINPANNLITNIGFGPEATHTITDDPNLNNQVRFEINEIKYPKKIKANTRLINSINTIAFGIKKPKLNFRKVLKDLLIKCHLYFLINFYRFLISKIRTYKEKLLPYYRYFRYLLFYKKYDKYLLCRPRGGLNDILNRLELCCLYAIKYHRKLYVDTNRSGFLDSLKNYFILPKYIFFDKINITNYPVSVYPSCLQNDIYNYEIECTADGYKIKDGPFLTFNFEKDYSEKYLIFENWGGGLIGINFLKRLKLRENIRHEIVSIIKKLGTYAAVHIRNTDMQTDYKQFLININTNLEYNSIVICTDDYAVQLYCKSLFGEKLILPTNIPELNGEKLHDNPNLERYKTNVDAIKDLFILACSDKLYTTKNTENFYSGFSLLAMNLHDSKKLIKKLLVI